MKPAKYPVKMKLKEDDCELIYKVNGKMEWRGKGRSVVIDFETYLLNKYFNNLRADLLGTPRT